MNRNIIKFGTDARYGKCVKSQKNDFKGSYGFFNELLMEKKLRYINR